MKTNEFTNAVKNKEIANGTKFIAKDGKKKLGELAVIDTKIFYLEMKQYPEDLLTNDKYVFERMDDK